MGKKYHMFIKATEYVIFQLKSNCKLVLNIGVTVVLLPAFCYSYNTVCKPRTIVCAAYTCWSDCEKLDIDFSSHKAY